MKINKAVVLIAVIAIVFSTTAVFAGNKDKIGGAGAQQLMIPIGSRSLAMAGAYNAMVSGNEAIYWNPAGLAATSATAEATFSNLQWLADTQVNFLAVSAKFGNVGAFGVSAKIFSFGKFEQTTEFETEGTGIMVEPTISTIALTYSRQMTDRIFFGVNAKLISESFMRTSASGMAFDVGVQYISSLGVRMGLTLNNFGGMMKYDGPDLQRTVDIPHTETGAEPLDMRFEAQQFELPSTFEIGLAYDYHLADQHVLTVAGNYKSQNYGVDEVQGGFEYAFNNMFFLRGGYATQTEMQKDNIFGMTAGAGFRYELPSGTAFVLDYAFRQTDFFENNQCFTFTVQF